MGQWLLILTLKCKCYDWGWGESSFLCHCAYIEKIIPFLKSFYKVFLCCKGQDKNMTKVTHS